VRGKRVRCRLSHRTRQQWQIEVDLKLLMLPISISTVSTQGDPERTPDELVDITSRVDSLKVDSNMDCRLPRSLTLRTYSRPRFAPEPEQAQIEADVSKEQLTDVSVDDAILVEDETIVDQKWLFSILGTPERCCHCRSGRKGRPALVRCSVCLGGTATMRGRVCPGCREE